MNLVRALFHRRFIEAVRYPVEMVGGLVTFYVLFLMVFLGALTFGDSDVRTSDTLSAVAVGYVVFMLALASYQGFGQQLMQESAGGTLEQLAMSPVGLRRVLLVDFFAQVTINVLTIGVVVVPIMATTGRWLHVDLVSVLPLVLATLSGVVGVGLAVGGLYVVFKRLQQVAQIIGFTFVFLVAAPVFDRPLLKLLPLGHGNALLRRVLVDEVSITELGAGEILTLLAVNIGWLVVGLVVFGTMERLARERALLGQY